jgi:DNA polymerase-1
MKTDLLIIDGRHLLWRTADAHSDLSAEVDGEVIPTGGIYGFLNVALKIHNAYGGKVVVAWEGDRNNFRVGLYPAYKKRNEPVDPAKIEVISEMAGQEKHLKRILAMMGVRQYAGVGCEADDVIGRLATEVAARGKRVFIYSGDSDLRQLIADGSIWTLSPGHGAKRQDKLYDVDATIERHGVHPKQLPQLKALSGDASDNIPGVRGIGPKTAAELVMRYGTLDAIIQAAFQNIGGPLPEGWPVPVRHRDAIVAQGVADQLQMYLKLTTIKVDCDMSNIPTCRRQADVVEELKRFKFRSLASPAELYGLMRMGG